MGQLNSPSPGLCRPRRASAALAAAALAFQRCPDAAAAAQCGHCQLGCMMPPHIVLPVLVSAGCDHYPACAAAAAVYAAAAVLPHGWCLLVAALVLLLLLLHCRFSAARLPCTAWRPAGTTKTAAACELAVCLSQMNETALEQQKHSDQNTELLLARVLEEGAVKCKVDRSEILGDLTA